MSTGDTKKAAASLVLEYELDASPQKVWRAISLAEYRENWLPQAALSDAEAHIITPEQKVSYRMRDNTSPFLESVVTFQISSNTLGGTNLKVIHELMDVRSSRITEHANNNRQLTMLAA